MDKILEAKKQLYYLLLKKNENDLTDTEVEIMYHLSKDKQIQDCLKGNINKK